MEIDSGWRLKAQELFASEDLAFTDAESRPNEDEYARRWRRRLKMRVAFLKEYVYGRYPNAVYNFFLSKREGEFPKIVGRLLSGQSCSHYNDHWEFLDPESDVWVVFQEGYKSRPPSIHHKFSRQRLQDLLRLVTHGYVQRWPEKRGQMQTIFEEHGLHLELEPSFLLRETSLFQPL